jgi:hypothetical protein
VLQISTNSEHIVAEVTNRILTQSLETDINNENLDEVVLNQLTQSIAELEPEIRHYWESIILEMNYETTYREMSSR